MAANRIVVGVDGSPGSLVAARWAAAEARLRGATLAVVHACQPPGDGAGSGSTAELGAAREALCAAGFEVGEQVTAARPAASLLLEQSADAAMVVVGARGAGSIGSGMLGAVAYAVAGGARCPVAIVPTPDVALPERAPVALGLSLVGAGPAALLFAIAEAQCRRVPLRIVRSWSSFDHPAGFDPAAARPGVAEQVALAERLVERARLLHPDVAIEQCFATEPVTELLLRQGESAALLVIGGRSAGPSRPARLGATASRLIQLCPRPLVVVPSR
jgi:nucleotide-binding universal stress UspA family protein